MLVDLAVAQTRRPFALEHAADPRLAAPDTDAGDLDRAIGGEQVGDVCPHLLIDIITVGILQVADEILVAHSRQPPFDRGRGIGRARRRFGEQRDRHAGFGGRIMVGNHLEIVLKVAPAILVRSRIHRIMVETRDLPDAVLDLVQILLDAALPARIPRPAAEHRQFVPAALGGPAIRRKIDDRRHRELRVERARSKPPDGRRRKCLGTTGLPRPSRSRRHRHIAAHRRARTMRPSHPINRTRKTGHKRPAAA